MNQDYRLWWGVLALAVLLLMAALVAAVVMDCNSPALPCEAAPELAPATGAETAWRHPLAVVADSGKANWSTRGHRTSDLYRWAISYDVPIRQWRFSYYHPDEAGGTGGGWSTADGGGFRPDCVASALRWYPLWRGHELWVQDVGRVTVGDNGPGWGSRYRFDLPGPSGSWVDQHDAGVGVETMRCIVVWCPRPAVCGCDWAQAWRRVNR